MIKKRVFRNLASLTLLAGLLFSGCSNYGGKAKVIIDLGSKNKIEASNRSIIDKIFRVFSRSAYAQTPSNVASFLLTVTGTVSVINGSSDSVTATINVGANPESCSILP